MTQYRQTGVQYSEDGVAYGAPVVVTPATIAATTTVLDEVNVQYSESGLAYSNNYTYGQSQTGIVEIVATVDTVAATTVFSAAAGVEANISVSTIAAVVTLPADITANYVDLEEVDLSAVGALPTPTLRADHILSVSTIAATGTISGTAEVDLLPPTVTAIASVGAVSITVDINPSSSISVTGNIGAQQMYTLYPGSEDIVPPVLELNKPTPAAYALMQHFAPRPRSENLFIINNSSVQNFFPVDASTITRTLYGGHLPPTDLTATEISLLEASGYPIDVGAGV